ncbi:MAG: hypothetical protein IPK16_15865 [Anaerolineales bacterium]|nr:hypothetical protein [Anaerolineales bacterium]
MATETGPALGAITSRVTRIWGGEIRLVEDLGEVNMADGDTLVDFVAWAAKEYPADKYVLILSDHGMGWPGGWSDPDPKAQANNRAPLAQAIGNNLFLSELDDALAKVQQTTGIEKFELIGMDACLMGHIEVMSALEPYANYAVVSQETEPALGWAYTSFLNSLSQNPDMTGAELSTAIVTSYIKDDQRILDDAERAAMTGRNPMGSLFASGPSAQDVANQMGRNVTLTAADLAGAGAHGGCQRPFI